MYDVMATHIHICVICFLYVLYIYPSRGDNEMYTNEYLLKINDGEVKAVKRLAGKFSFVFVKKVLRDLYLFNATKQQEWLSTDDKSYIKNFTLAAGDKVLLIERQVLRKYLQPVPRKTVPVGNIVYPDVVLRNYHGMGIEQAWNLSFMGQNVTVAVVDIGVAMNQSDLMDNMDPSLSFNYADGANQSDANPPRNTSYLDGVDISHGTKCARLVAAIKGNKFCSSGVAPKAKLAAIRFLNDDAMGTDVWMGPALNHKLESVDIYSNSWGSTMNCGFSKPGIAFLTAILDGVKMGRNKKGSIYTFPAGNWGNEGGCNTDGYVNGVHGITIASVGINGSRPKFAQICACALAATFGEGSKFDTDTMLTTSNEDCTTDFSETSSSVAIASGMVALTLGANPHLTYRDVQHIIVNTASFELLQKSDDWITNGAGRKVSPYFGFGLMNATAMVQAALSWTAVPERHNCTSANVTRSNNSNSEIQWTFFTDGCLNALNAVEYLEHVQVNITFNASDQSDVEFQLKSPMFPSNASSLLLAKLNSTCKEGKYLFNWHFTTVHFWGEHPMGEWKLIMKLHNEATAAIVDASLVLYGTAPATKRHLGEKQQQETPEEHPKDERNVAVIAIFGVMLVLIMALMYIAGCKGLKDAEREYKKRGILKTRTDGSYTYQELHQRENIAAEAGSGDNLL